MLPVNDVIHLAITGIAQGCAYGLIALGFVLIYKATEVVNFAHGEFMMLGAFAVLAFSEAFGLGFWPAFFAGAFSIAAVGYLLDAQIMRRIIGESQASVFILTVAFGFIFRALAGMIFANLFYWGTNQYVIQRTLGASSLAEGQKGVLISGYFKLLVPFMMMIPGIIAFHLYGESLGSIDLAYPRLVSDVLPKFMTGFFLAVLLGAVFSSYNSLLNSAATMFVLDVYAPLKKNSLSNDQLVNIAKIVSVMLALLSFVIAPMLQFAPRGLWELIRVFTGFYNVPIIVIVLIGLTTKNVPALAAKVVVIFHAVAYALYRFVFEFDIHYVHVYAILAIIEIAIMLIIGQASPNEQEWSFSKSTDTVDMIPWRYAVPVSSTLLTLIVVLYLIFSPIGLVNGLSGLFWPVFALALVANSVFCWYYLMSGRD